MTKGEVLMLLQADLNQLAPDEMQLAYLRHLLDASLQLTAKEGVKMSEPYTPEDAQLLIMYAGHLFRKRNTGEPMPRMLRWALNNRIFSEKAGSG